MIRYKKYQFTGENHPLKGLWYARPVIEETFDTEMLILDGKNVKLDDLAIFSVGIVSKKGAASAAEFTLANNVKGLKLRARATGELSNAQINLEGQLKEAFKYNADNGSGNGGSTPGGNGEEEDPLG